MQALIDAGRERKATRNTSWWESLLEAARSLLRPTILRHAVAALRRGNPEAAFALLREEVSARPGRAESALLFWNVALSCERAGEAADGMVRLIRAEAAAEESLEQAANHWTALVDAVPAAVVEVSALAKILPLLRARSEQARGEAARMATHALLVDALRRCVDPAHGSLSPALALRIVEEARGVDVEVARRAAQVALQSTTLHEAKRARLEDLLRALERGQWPEASAAAPPARAADPPRAASRPAASPAARPAARPLPAPKAETRVPERPTARPVAAAAARPARPRPAVAPVAAEPANSSTSGRRTVALTQDEIEAASSRLAERMAARRASHPPAPATSPPQTPPPPAAPTPAEPPETVEASEPEVVAEPQEKEEPIAILEQGEAVAILEEEDEDAILEACEATPLESADFEFGGAAAAPESSEEFEIDAELEDEGPLEDFEIGTALADDESSDDFEIGTALADDESSDDFAIGTALADDESSDDFAIGIAPAAEVSTEAAAEPSTLSDAVGEAPREAARGEEPAPTLRAIDIVPVEIGADGLVAFEIAHAQRTRVDYRAIEAIAAAEVAGLAEEPILVSLLVLRSRPGRPRSALRMRCDAFDPASLFPDRTDAGQALRAMLADLLERTRAVPLPDPDSALAVHPQRFESLSAFEAQVLARLPG